MSFTNLSISVLLSSNASIEDDSSSSSWVDDTWVRNSIATAVSVGDFTNCLYFIMSLSVAIILHSWLINGRRWKIVQLCTEIAALSTVGLCACFLYCTNYDANDDSNGDSCDLRISAYMINVVASVICGSINQICDNYIVFSRYVVICGSVSNRKFIFHDVSYST